MKVEFTKNFIKNYKKRFSHQQNIQKRFEQRTRTFAEDPTNIVLKGHSLIGTKVSYRAFSITGDIRVIYYIKGKIAYFVDIGTHNQVYGK